MQDPVKGLRVRLALSAVILMMVLAAASLTQAAGPTISSGLCTVAATPLAFGKYDPLGHQDGVTVSMLHYRCFGTHKRLTISLMTGESGSFRARKMRWGKDEIVYNLYLDAAGTQVWGDGTGGSQAYIVNSPSSGSDVSIPVYGRLFGDQNDSAGNYHDDVSVLVSY
jgi:spore coat protein U-like protein